MGKIIAKKDVLEYCKNAKPGNKAVYFNMDAIDELPDLYEAVLTELKFNIEKDFDSVGEGNLMPATALMYDIAKAMGISGGANSITEPVYEEVDINPMLMKGLEAEPTFRKIIVGRKVVKYSTVMQEDGSIRRSSSCSSIFNVWERCMELWMKEEENTNGYDASIMKKYADGNPYYEYTFKGKVNKKSVKYNTTYKRRAQFNKELKFAHAKAETKSNTKTIRELSGLMTGYTAEDLKEGKFIFAKFRKSGAALKLEQAANLSRIANGDTPSPAALELFAPNEEDVFTDTVDDIPEATEPEPTAKIKPVTDKERLLGIFQTYEHIEGWDETQLATIGKCTKWLQTDMDEKDPNYSRIWTHTIGLLKKVEAKVDMENRVEHDFY